MYALIDQCLEVVTVETKKERRSGRLSEKQAMLANEVQMEPRAKKKRSDGRMSNIATMDNGTMVEAFKFLNYYQLAKNSLVSKRYRDLITTHRHKLTLLYVHNLVLRNFYTNPSSIIVFDKQLSPEDYEEWVICNQYSKKIPIEGQVDGKPSAQYGRFYEIRANATHVFGHKNVFHAKTRLNHKHWPLFQHFIRLLMDPFIYVQHIELIPQNDFLNLLSGAFNEDSNRLQCKTLQFNFDGNVQKFIIWMKSHVSCDEIRIQNDSDSNNDEDLIDILVTGAQCTSAVRIDYSIPTKMVFEFVQKFMDLKSSDEYQVVESIRDQATLGFGSILEREYAEYIIKETYEDGITERVLEFVNSDVGKKLQITVNIEHIMDPKKKDSILKQSGYFQNIVPSGKSLFNINLEDCKKIKRYIQLTKDDCYELFVRAISMSENVTDQS